MHSALYSGWVQHRRFAPRAHAFRYRMGLLYLDLSEQAQLFALSKLAGSGRWAPFAFRESDYLPESTRQGVALHEAVRDRVEQALGTRPQGRICVLTQPRSWGLAFNPVSIFYCHDADQRLMAILCEVSNTPWRERYHYVLPAEGEGRHQVSVDKAFHVSPFLPREGHYVFRFDAAPGRFGAWVDWFGKDGKLWLQTSMTGKARALTAKALRRAALRHAFQPLRVTALIHWQAAKLLSRGVRYRTKPLQLERRQSEATTERSDV